MKHLILSTFMSLLALLAFMGTSAKLFAQPSAQHKQEAAKAPDKKDSVKEKASAEKDLEFIQKVKQYCAEIKSERFATLASADNLKPEFIKALSNFEKSLSVMTDAENAQGWCDFLEIKQLKKTLESDNVDLAICDKTLDALNSKEPGLEFDIFTQFRQKLEKFMRSWELANWSKQEQDDYKQACDEFPKDLEALLKEYDPDKAELIAVSLAYIGDYAANVKTFALLKSTVLNYFSTPNCYILFSENYLKQEPKQKFKEKVQVNEIIRGSMVTGNGTIEGQVEAKFVPNNNRAQIDLVFDSHVRTQTTAVQNGVQVQSTNKGIMEAKKSIFLRDNLSTEPTKVKGSMDSSITGIFSDRVLGWNIIQQRVAEEQPYSKAESQQRMEQRFAERLDQEVAKRLKPGRDYIDKTIFKFFRDIDFMPRKIKTYTTKTDLYWTAIMAVKSQTALTPNLLKARPDNNITSDLNVFVHTSVLNNAFFNKYSAQRVSDQEIAEQMQAILPPSKKKEEDKKASDKPKDTPLWLQFSDKLPIVVSFADNKISTVLHFDSFEKDDKEYPELTIYIDYEIVKKDSKYSLNRVQMDARPGALKPGQVIPARYQAIRTIVLNKLKESMDEKIELEPIKVRNSDSDNTKQSDFQMRDGVFVPFDITAEGNWLSMKYEFVPEKKSK